jgi:hypothetical protein
MSNKRVMRRVVNLNMVKDECYYLHPQSGASDDKCSGVLVGLVGGLMSCSLTFEDCVLLITENIPVNARLQCIPASWVHSFNDCILKHRPDIVAIGNH